MNIDEIRATRDQKLAAAQAMVEADDFDPTAESYRSLKDEAARLNTQAEHYAEAQEAAQRQAQVDSRLLKLGTPSSSGVVVGHEDVYRPGGQRSFFADMYAARQGDTAAREALDRHQRALTSATAAGGGGNIIPPQYLASLFAPDAKFGAPVAASFPQYSLANAAPFNLPKQTGSGSIQNQSAENTHPTPVDPTFSQVAVTPVTKVGSNVFSRQLLDGSNPAIDQIIASDLRGELLESNDTLATAALLSAGGATDTSTTDAKTLLQTILKGIPLVYGARKAPADTVYMSPAAFGYLAAALDSTGRPLINAYAPMNAFGAGNTADMVTSIGGLPVILAPTIVEAAVFKVVIAKRSDFGFFTSGAIQFRYEEKSGPESIEIGVWQYVAALTGRYPTGVRVITHTP